jgi:hypothetical protein
MARGLLVRGRGGIGVAEAGNSAGPRCCPRGGRLAVWEPGGDLPVAIDTAGIERDVSGTWALLRFTSRAALSDLERTVTEKLAEKARSRDYLDRQRQEARETVQEFARRWLIEQTRWRPSGIQEIRVAFADERATDLVR